MEEYGYLLNKLHSDVDRFSTTKHLNLKPTEIKESHYVFFIGIILVLLILWFFG